MRKLEYFFETREGQLHKWHDRKNEEFKIRIDMEPKSKKGIKPEEKIQFQRKILQELKNRNKRAFSGPIVIEFNFFPKEDNPPHIHTLAKNYLDLLETPIEGSGIKRKNLLFKDDRQVESLIVNHHIETRNEYPSITIKATSIGNFKKDLRLLDKIRHNSFENEHRLEYDIEEILKANNSTQSLSFEDTLVEYNEVKNWKDNHNPEIKTQKMLLQKMLLQNLQESYFQSKKIEPMDLLYFYSDLLLGKDTISLVLKDVYIQYRDILIYPPFSLPVKNFSPPNNNKSKTSFKDDIKGALLKLKDTNNLLFSPLLINTSLIILYIPPKDELEADLDNLARYIIPKVNDIFEPSGKFYFSQEEEQSFTQNSITQYQIIKVPRSKNDSESGSIRLIINKRENGILKELDSIIRKWENIT